MNNDVQNLMKSPRWTVPTDLYIGDIIEYDMVDGGFSIIKEESLLPQSEIKRLESLPKGFERNDAVGKLRYSKNEEFRDTGKKLEKLFGKYREMFAVANEIEVSDVFSIKRDAVFLTRYASNLKFGDHIEFKEKHSYNIYLLLGKDELITNFSSRHKTYEVYYNTLTDDIAIKGIKDDKLDNYHTEFIITAIKRYLRYLSSFDYLGATKYVVKLIDDYKFHRLPIGFYREFNDESHYKIQIDGKEFSTEEADESMFEYLDIRYNFNHILVPMLNMASLGIGKDARR